MTPQDQKSILTIALYAAFADGDKHDREREEIRRIADTLAAQAHAPELGGLYQDVLLQRVTLDAVATALSCTGLRQLVVRFNNSITFKSFQDQTYSSETQQVKR